MSEAKRATPDPSFAGIHRRRNAALKALAVATRAYARNRNNRLVLKLIAEEAYRDKDIETWRAALADGEMLDGVARARDEECDRTMAACVALGVGHAAENLYDRVDARVDREMGTRR